MSLEPLLVGGTAVVLGLIAMLAAIHNRDFYFNLPKARWMEVRFGRGATRLAYFTIGALLFVWGIYIANGA